MTVCWMIWYCYSFPLGFKCICQLYSSGFSISWYIYRYHETLCNGQLHLITVYRTGFRVCVVLVLNAIMCSFTNSLIEFYFIMVTVTIIGIFIAIILILNYTLRLSITKKFYKCAPPWIFPSMDTTFEYYIEHSILGLFYVMFRFSIWMFYRRIQGLCK